MEIMYISLCSNIYVAAGQIKISITYNEHMDNNVFIYREFNQRTVK